ncbi:MAG: PHP domain-containing protein [Clostridia bacterium]|nr:PHP domain-containing protein [Clostridia bacterium]
MVDMHMHTTYSDGTSTLEEVLKICEEKKLDYISLTDHNTCKEYDDKAFLNNKTFSGKIIKGVEMNATFKNKSIEVLGYNIKETQLIEEWSQKFFSEEVLRKQQEESKRKLLDICDRKGLVYDESKIRKDIPLTDYITIYIYKELITHEENIPILGEFAESLNVFIRKGLMNPESEYYVSNYNPKPMYKDVVDIIHKAGGIAFLAHPFEYRFEDTINFIDELRKEKELDGIECFHPSAETENRIDILIDYARKNNLYISGGSDYHGSKKPDIDIGSGRGTLNIPSEYIKEWI